jgi:hypothetical protein
MSTISFTVPLAARVKAVVAPTNPEPTIAILFTFIPPIIISTYSVNTFLKIIKYMAYS